LKIQLAFEVAFQTNNSFGYIHASVAVIFLNGSEAGLSHLI